MLKTLVVTADDFGLSIEINRAVELAHTYGILSAASLMVNAPATHDAIARARRLPRLSVGLHLVLVDGTPSSPNDLIPQLLKKGRFRQDLTRLGFGIAFKGKIRAQLRREIRAQFEAFVATGLPLHHVDVHKHFHLHPIVGAEVISIGREFGLRSMRVPSEPAEVIESIEGARSLTSRILAPCVAILRRQASQAGLITADRVFGLAWSGAMDEKRLIGILSRSPQGSVTEIYCHPAITDEFEGRAPGYAYRSEFEALMSPAVAEAVRRRDFRLGSYADCE